MRVKVQPSAGASLCSTCRDAQIVEFDNGDQETRCHSRGMEPIVIRRAVARCKDYDDERVPDRYDMEKLAWVVTTDKRGKAIGFQPPPKKE